MKEDDDKDDEQDERTGYSDEEGLLGGGVLKVGSWRKHLLRRLSLALAVYGVIVMIVCLITNTYFTVAH